MRDAFVRRVGACGGGGAESTETFSRPTVPQKGRVGFRPKQLGVFLRPTFGSRFALAPQ